MEFSEFILAHDGEDLGRLALARDRYAQAFPDFDLALTTLEVRAKLRKKVPEWYAVPSLRYPLRLSAEQCSSTETARYKAAVAFSACDGNAHHAKSVQNALSESLALSALRDNAPKCVTGVSFRLADLTGGLGVDSWAFAQVFGQVLYNEMRPELADAALRNFKELGINNITVRNSVLGSTVRPGMTEGPEGAMAGPERPSRSIQEVLGDFRPDILFLDPARRAADGRKVFRLEDCQPDVLRLLPELLAVCPYVLLKLSPMADITLVCKQLGCVKEVHVVAAEGECKELLLLLERGYEGPHRLFVCENGSVLDLSGSGIHLHESMTTLGLVRAKLRRFVEVNPAAGRWLFEPGKGLLKAGAFEWPCQYGLEKLGRHTHLYVGEAVPQELMPFGKTFEILEVVPLNKQSFKDLGRRYPQAEVSAHNIPLSADELRARLGVRSGGKVHIFGAHCDVSDQHLLIVAGT